MAGPGARKPSVGEGKESSQPLVCSALVYFLYFSFFISAPILACEIIIIIIIIIIIPMQLARVAARIHRVELHGGEEIVCTGIYRKTSLSGHSEKGTHSLQCGSHGLKIPFI